MIVSDDEENPTTDDFEEDGEYRIIPKDSKPFHGRVARAVSLCLYNKFQMAQLNWPGTIGITRHSTSQLEDHHYSSSLKVLKTTYRKSIDVHKINELHEQTSPIKDIEPIYDGLITLDEILLDKMIETDLISSNC